MVKENMTNTERYKLVKQYLFSNYSGKFVRSGQWHIINSSVKESSFVAKFDRNTGDGFIIEFDLKNKKITQKGNYILNRGINTLEE